MWPGFSSLNSGSSKKERTSESLSRRATSRGVSVRSEIGWCVTGSKMLYAMTTPVRSMGATAYARALAAASPAWGGSDDTAMSTSFAKKSDRAWSDDVFVTLSVNAWLPLHRSAAHW